MNDSPLFSVVIPNWNGKHFLQVCFDSLRAQTYPSIEVILVDNASSDGSQMFVKAEYPWVRLIELPTNTGFTGACNAGMKAASGAVICLLNNDTEVEPTWAAHVMDAFARHPQVGSVASKMLLFDRRDHIHTTGDTFSLDGRAGNRGVWQKDDGQYDHEDFVFSACGGSSAYRREMLDQGLPARDARPDWAIGRRLLLLDGGRRPRLAGAIGRLAVSLHAQSGRVPSSFGHRRRRDGQLLRGAQRPVVAGQGHPRRPVAQARR
ncbi:MAG: glycosyltransferase family 2 protein [Anaerolineae bacterium]|nr:glycosyltransferase family 2 protein [Anaerolineae bacterium]